MNSKNETKNIKDYNNLLKEAKKQHKKIFVDVYTDWCGFCKEMDETTFSNPQVKAELKKNYIIIKINGDFNKKLSEKYKIEGYPTLIVLNSNGKVIKKYTGYQVPKEFLKWLTKK
ncbi:MAG: thioredoxin domain-containing protein [Methanobacterium sp.]|nr:thioredoxin domain-containing protein [Methanobacterium sp.]